MARGKVMSDSSKDELEKLKKQRAELESKLAAKWKHRTPFELEAASLRERVIIQELKEELDRVNDRATKASPETRGQNELKSKKELATLGILQKSGAKINVGELEDKTKSTKELATLGILQKSGAKVKDKTDKPETDEQTRTIWKKSEQTPESDETPEEKDKKKRRFF
jgi:hypothetical protein